MVLLLSHITKWQYVAQKEENIVKNEARTWYFDLKARPLSSVSIESNFENDDVSEVVTVSNLLLTSVLEESFIWRSMSPKLAIFSDGSNNVWSSMFDRSKPKIGCLGLITNRWTHSSLFHVTLWISLQPLIARVLC